MTSPVRLGATNGFAMFVQLYMIETLMLLQTFSDSEPNRPLKGSPSL